MDIACERGLMVDIFDVGSLFKYRLMKVCNASTLGNIMNWNKLVIFFCRLPGIVFRHVRNGMSSFPSLSMPYSRASSR